MSRLLEQLRRATQSREAARSAPGTPPTLLQKALERAASEPTPEMAALLAARAEAEARDAADREAARALELRIAEEEAAAEALRQKIRAETRALESARQRAIAESRLAEKARTSALEAQALEDVTRLRERAEASLASRAPPERDAGEPLEEAVPARTTIPGASASWRPAAAMVVVIASLAAVAWHATREGEASGHHKPKVFQLDYQLDLNRTGGAARSSPPGPDPSR